ncbi:MAG TPA: putative porin [Gammaproteobacteria bacterium]
MATTLRAAPAVVLSALAFSATAEDFSWQVSGGYGATELAPYADTERTVLDATYYFDPVDDSRGPYALAPFLNRSSRVTAGVVREKTTLTTLVATIGSPPPGTPTAIDVTEDSTGYVFGGRYVWPRSGWYVGASYRNEEMDHEPSSSSLLQDTTTDGYQLFGGRYLGESTTVDLGAGTTEQTTELVITCITSLCLSGRTATHVDTEDWSIGTTHVRRGPRLSYAITGRFSRADVTPSIDELVLAPPVGTFPLRPTTPMTIAGGVSVAAFTPIAAPFSGPSPVEDERDVLSLGGELFPTDRLGVRIGFARAEGDYIEDDTLDLGATWFFKPGIAIELVVARTETEIGALERDIDRAEVRFLGRL